MKRWPKPWSTPSGGVDHGLEVPSDLGVRVRRLNNSVVLPHPGPFIDMPVVLPEHVERVEECREHKKYAHGQRTP